MESLTELSEILQILIDGVIYPVLGNIEVAYVGRLCLVLILCGIIGLERSEHERASGFRPHILVGIGACLMTIAGAYSFPDDEIRDPMRVASYVVSGIGFLGGGAILRHGATVRGLTTAASIWGAAGIGIAVGIGMGGLATISTLLILFTLTTLERVEERLGRGESVSDLKIHLKDNHRAVGKALTALERLGVSVKRATMMPAVDGMAVVKIEFGNPMKFQDLSRLTRQLLTLKAIARVDITALEVEDSDDLFGIHHANQDGYHFDDDNLLKDLNEPNGH